MTKSFTTPDPALAIGTSHQGFTVTAIEPLPDITGIAYVMRHDASGARLMWIATADTNRSFAIAFKTPPADDTGVFHILEHSVLCGSDRFPVKEPFVNLLKSSMNTFLNALTFPDKTMYPVSSTNVTDLENLMDVYLDAVLHPAIYQRPRIFEQEGWHYELPQGTDGPLTYNGVVFNEMKGALSDPDDVAFMHVNRALFPDTAYRWESGGHPRAIPTLTYDHFIDTHARHYNLPNSYTILYGDLDIERELAFVGERFDGAAQRGAGAPNPLEVQKPVVAPLKQVTMATAPENASVTLAYVVGTAGQRERMLAMKILLDAIAGSNEAPLKRAVLDADLGDDFQVSLIDSLLQPVLIFVLEGAHEGVADRFASLVAETCDRIVREGVDRDRLKAGLSQTEFNLREGDWGGSYSDGVALSMAALKSWLYDDDRPVDYLRFEQELTHLRENLQGSFFEDLLREMVLDNDHHAAIELVPVEEGDAADEAAELQARKAAMTDADLAHVLDEVAALREEQERPDAPEDLAKLPHLKVEDIGDAPAETRARLVDAPLPCLAHELDTHRIIYASYYFDLGRLAWEDLPYVGLLTDLLGHLDTDRLSAAELDTTIEENLGSLIFLADVYGTDDDLDSAVPKLTVSASALSEKVASLASLPAEVWRTTRFDNLDQIHDLMLQRRLRMEQTYLNAGHSSAMARLSSYYSKAGLAQGAMTGIDYYLFIKDLLARWDELSADLPTRLTDLAQHIFTADEVLVSLTCSEEDRQRFWEAAGDLGLPRLGDQADAHQLQIPEPTVRNEAFVTPANVCFVAEAQPPCALDHANLGTWIVACQLLSYDYLWNEVRVKGGAYGCGFVYSITRIMRFWTYRDPGVDQSVARFEQAHDWIGAWNPSDDEFAGYIVSTVAGHDSPIKPRQLARRQDNQFFVGRPDDFRDKLRAQMLATTPEAVRGLAATLAQMPQNRAFCVFGSRDLIEASELDLTVIDLMG